MAAMTPKKTRIAHYLAQGVSPANAATICGVQISYISQLVKEDQDFQFALAEMQAAVSDEIDAEKDLDLKYLGLEHKIINSIDASLAGGSLSEQVAALKAVIERQDRRAKRQMPTQQAGVVVNQVTNLILPAHAIRTPEVQLNELNQIVAVGQQAMAPLTSGQVKDLFSGLKGSKIQPSADVMPVQKQDAVEVLEGQYMAAEDMQQPIPHDL